jgi:hypothetical protein
MSWLFGPGDDPFGVKAGCIVVIAIALVCGGCCAGCGVYVYDRFEIHMEVKHK